MVATVVGAVLTVLLGFIVFIFRDSIKGKWDTALDYRDRSRHRIKVRVLHLAMPGDASQLDFSAEIQNLNHMQNMFLFQIEDTRIPMTDTDVRELQEAKTQETFLNSLRRFVTSARGEPWDEVDKKATKTGRSEPRDLVITNFPIPGYFYGWNSRDRRFLVISPVSVIHLFPGDPEPSIADFIVCMAQRMAVFCVTPKMNPLRTHLELAAGCLFDFTPQLRRVRQVVIAPIVCDDCMRQIKRRHGRTFALKIETWIKGTN